MMCLHSNLINKETVSFNWGASLGQDWATALSTLIESDYSDHLVNFIEQIYLSEKQIYPERKEKIFKPFRLTSINNVKIVIIDDSPELDCRSSGIGRGIIENGFLAKDVPLNLRQFRDCIYETIYGNVSSVRDFDNSLTKYAEDGMLFLNSSMCSTSKEDYALIWKEFIRNVIKIVDKKKENVIFLFLTGNNSDLYDLINIKKNYIFKNSQNYIPSYCDIFIKADNIISDKLELKELISW